MTDDALIQRFHSLARVRLRRPGAGATAERHRAILAAGRESLSLAKLIEAHWDAVAILEEAGKQPALGALYAVWASEVPGASPVFENGVLRGRKEFCSGATLVDRALVTAGPLLVELDLRSTPGRLSFDESGWNTEAFRLTHTATVMFDEYLVVSVVGDSDWYTRRSGFWLGACGPAAAWVGGAAGLVDYAMTAKRGDPHTLAHLAAMQTDVWTMETLLVAVGETFDRGLVTDAMVAALQLRHMVEQLCTDILRRFARSFGPAPLVKDAETALRYTELDVFLRQSHAERDLEQLGMALRECTTRACSHHAS